MASGTYFRPRMAATLTVPILGTRAQRINQEASTEAINLVVRPKRIQIESNDHNHADSATLVADWTEVGVDPRMLDNAVVQIFIANADDFGRWTPSRENCRFIGLAKDVSADRDGESAAEVTFDCVDYTNLFLRAKPFGSSGIPRYSQSLDEAWRTIVSQTPGAGVLADRLVLQGIESFPSLGKAVSERFAKLSFVPTHPETDAWAVWQQCVGMCGLISYIKGDQCIVTTATNYYSEGDSPVLIWGKNIQRWGETRHSEISRKGVGITSYDPITQTTLDAFWPPVGDESVKAKRYTGKKKLSTEQIRAREERDMFPFAGITQLEALIDVAKRVYEERSRQELEGHVSTGEMDIETESASNFDLLNLAAGDSVKVMVDPKERQLLANLPTEGAQLRYLTTRGYSEDAAKLIVANMQDFGELESKFLTKSVTTEIQVDDEDGTFAVSFDYINRIEIDGSATA